LWTADRVLVESAGRWQLFDSSAGRSLRSGSVGAGEIVLDPPAGLFHAPDLSGLVMACRLTDGSLVHRMFAFAGPSYRRSLLAPHGRRLTVLSEESAGSGEVPYPPDLSVLERYDLGDPPVLAPDGFLTSARLERRLARRAVPTLVVLHNGAPVVVAPNRIYVFDEDLRLIRGLTAAFSPLSLSCDDSGILRLQVRAPDRIEFRSLALDGAWIARMALPAEVEPGIVPPIAAYDGRTFLVGAHRATAIAPEGKLLWSVQPPGAIAGASVTADGLLLVSCGPRLLAYPPEGEPQLVYSCPEGTLQSPAVLTDKGALLAATARHLLCLAV
jgi:hypothetical protein